MYTVQLYYLGPGNMVDFKGCDCVTANRSSQWIIDTSTYCALINFDHPQQEIYFG